MTAEMIWWEMNTGRPGVITVLNNATIGCCCIAFIFPDMRRRFKFNCVNEHFDDDMVAKRCRLRLHLFPEHLAEYGKAIVEWDWGWTMTWGVSNNHD